MLLAADRVGLLQFREAVDDAEAHVVAKLNLYHFGSKVRRVIVGLLEGKIATAPRTVQPDDR